MNSGLREWKPDPGTFDLEWLEPTECDGVALRQFKITTTVFPEGPVRTYGVVGVPAGRGPFPAILHIHGGCQAACPGSVAYQVRRGYAAMSLDWSGSKPYTEYPPEIDTADPLLVVEKKGADRCFPVMAAKAARCCLSLLASLDSVDPARIGVYGISWGGFITWLVNGTDATPKCACAVYGTGGLHWPGHLCNDLWGRLSQRTREEWMQQVEPAVYAAIQKSPLLHINGANDFFGGFDVAAESLPSIPPAWRCDWTPNCNHGFDRSSTNLMNAWFDHHLKGAAAIPAAPQVKVERIGDSTIRVTTAGAPERMTLWYSCGNAAHPDRCWHAAGNWKRDADGQQVIEVPVTGNVWLYVRERHDDRELTVSSTPICFDMPSARARPQQLLFDGRTRRDGWGYRMSIMPQSPGDLDRLVAIGDDGLTIRTDPQVCGALVYFGVSDPDCVPGYDTAFLEVEIEGAASFSIGCGISILECFNSTLEAPGDGVHRIALGQFRNGANLPLPDFRRVGHLIVSGTARDGKSFRIKRLAWA